MRICTFCGHRWVSESIRVSLAETVEKLIVEQDVHCFYVGNNGAFDRMALGVLKELKTKHPHIRYFVVLAYMPGKKEEYPFESQVDTIYPESLENVPRRYAIVHRNRWMVEQSDYLIAYVVHDSGGAAQTLRYALRRDSVQITNLASDCKDAL